MKLEKKVLNGYIPKHIAIIMDGNGRWAKKRHMPRTYGHKKGSENLKNIALECKGLGVKVLSVYAFSTENWQRPKKEVDYLMTLPGEFEASFKGQFEKEDIRVVFSGRRDRFPKKVQDLIKRVEEKTENRTGMTLNICFDYGSYTEITNAVQEIALDVKNNDLNISAITPDVISNHLYTKDLPKLDLLIRTSGELRLSNFFLWQVSYSELYFAKKHWPAFNKKALLLAIEDFQNRKRRYGGLKEKKS
ncbi:MAG: isoprenyl transferase [Candidatus Izimaplasma sp.]|nr:isoprenyl transferase [Candidatus Izimaplasma bacterium]